MTDERWERAEKLFSAALEMTDSERDAFLREHCTGDEELLKEVQSLLAHRDERFLENPSHLMPSPNLRDQETDAGDKDLDPTEVLREDSENLTGRIGPYRLLQKLGAGGMGEVYEAEQEEPVRRRVALKVIKAGMDSKQVIARFEAERQALALMNHPNVAKVFDAGTTDRHRPYFAMELIKGVPITEYCDRQRLTTAERLELVMQVCSGVQHAHQKGIIHRDLKPSNVLIQTEGDERIPKIIDFGVAKATGQRLTERTMFTQLGVMIGTPEYMSPEQAEMTGEDIDTRTDVYSLGVLLYELLVGVLPFESKELRSAGFDEIRRKIREDEPAKPSTRLTSLGDVSSESAKRRNTDLRTLGRQLSGDLDWITMCAMEKDRTRRYNSPSEFAADIGRHLKNEPIQARRPGTMYLLDKFVQRNKVLVGGATATLVVLVAGIAVSTAFGFREAAQRREVTRQRDELTRQKYVANIIAAGSSLGLGEIEQAKQRLSECPPALRGWEWNYFKKIADRSLMTLTGHEAGVEFVAFSPDGTRIASSSEDKAVKIWDAASGQLLATPTGFEDAGGAIALFGTDGMRIASGSGDGTVRVWDETASNVLATLKGHDAPVTAAAISPDGTRIATGGDDRTVRLWDAASGQLLKTLPGFRGGGRSVTFNSDGTRIASGSGTHVQLWDTASGDLLRTLKAPKGGVVSVAFSPDGTRIATGSLDWVIRLWDVSSGELLHTLTGHENLVQSVAFSPDGTRVASGSEDKTVRLWDAETGEQLISLQGHELWVVDVAFSPDGTRIVSGSGDRTLRLWDAETRKIPVTVQEAWPQDVSVAFSPDGTRIASGDADGIVRLWSIASHELLATMTGHDGTVWTVAFSPDGTRIATASKDDTVRVWDAASGALLTTLTAHDGAGSVTFSPDGKRIASGTGGVVRLWDAASGELVKTVTESDDDIALHPLLTPNGMRFISYAEDGNVRIRDAASFEVLTTLTGHAGWATDVAFSPDGTLIATGSQDRTVRLWDAASGELLATLRVVNSNFQGVFTVAFSPDGTRIATASTDGVMLWP